MAREDEVQALTIITSEGNHGDQKNTVDIPTEGGGIITNKCTSIQSGIFVGAQRPDGPGKPQNYQYLLTSSERG